MKKDIKVAARLNDLENYLYASIGVLDELEKDHMYNDEICDSLYGIINGALNIVSMEKSKALIEFNSK